MFGKLKIIENKRRPSIYLKLEDHRPIITYKNQHIQMNKLITQQGILPLSQPYQHKYCQQQYKRAIQLLKLSNQQSRNLAEKILKDLLEDKLQSYETNEGNIALKQNIILTCWKTMEQHKIDNLQILRLLKISYNYLKKYYKKQIKKKKSNNFIILKIILAKQQYCNKNYNETLKLCNQIEKEVDSFFKNKYYSELIKVHYLKVKCYKQLKMHQNQCKQINKCIFYLKYLHQNNSAQYSHQFLKSLINRKLELYKVYVVQSEEKQKNFKYLKQSQDKILFRSRSSKTILSKIPQQKSDSILIQSIKQQTKRPRQKSLANSMKLRIKSKLEIEKSKYQISKQKQEITQPNLFLEQTESENYWNYLLQRPQKIKDKVYQKLLRSKRKDKQIISNQSQAYLKQQINILNNSQISVEDQLINCVKKIQGQFLQRCLLRISKKQENEIIQQKQNSQINNQRQQKWQQHHQKNQVCFQDTVKEQGQEIKQTSEKQLPSQMIISIPSIHINKIEIIKSTKIILKRSLSQSFHHLNKIYIYLDFYKEGLFILLININKLDQFPIYIKNLFKILQSKMDYIINQKNFGKFLQQYLIIQKKLNGKVIRLQKLQNIIQQSSLLHSFLFKKIFIFQEYIQTMNYINENRFHQNFSKKTFNYQYFQVQNKIVTKKIFQKTNKSKPISNFRKYIKSIQIDKSEKIKQQIFPKQITMKILSSQISSPLEKQFCKNIQLECLTKYNLLQLENNSILNFYDTFPIKFLKIIRQKIYQIKIIKYELKKIFQNPKQNLQMFYKLQIKDIHKKTISYKLILTYKDIYEQLNCQDNELETNSYDIMRSIFEKILLNIIIIRKYIYSNIGFISKYQSYNYYITNEFKKIKDNRNKITSIQQDNNLNKRQLSQKQFLQKKLKTKKILCQKILKISYKKTKQTMVKSYTILTLLSLQFFNKLQVYLYFPALSRTYTTTIDKDILDYYNQNQIHNIFFNIYIQSKDQLRDICWNQFLKGMKINWRTLFQMIKISKLSISENGNQTIFIMQIGAYNSFLKDCSLYHYQIINKTLIYLTITSQTSKEIKYLYESQFSSQKFYLTISNSTTKKKINYKIYLSELFQFSKNTVWKDKKFTYSQFNQIIISFAEILEILDSFKNVIIANMKVKYSLKNLFTQETTQISFCQNILKPYQKNLNKTISLLVSPSPKKTKKQLLNKGLLKSIEKKIYCIIYHQQQKQIELNVTYNNQFIIHKKYIQSIQFPFLGNNQNYFRLRKRIFKYYQNVLLIT